VKAKFGISHKMLGVEEKMNGAGRISLD